MDLQYFAKLQKKFENKRFEHFHYWTKQILYYGSFLGNILSVILSYFFVSKLTSETAVHFAGQAWILPLFIILFLTIFEFAKRFTVGNTITTFLTNKKGLSGGLIGGVLFSFLLVALTFYLSLSGASYYANKSDIIETTTTNTINVQTDSLSKFYTNENKKYEDRINYLYKAAESRKRKSLTESEVSQVKAWEFAIKDNKIELDKKIQALNESQSLTADKEKAKSSSNQWAFILISAFIEILIIVGVGFKCYWEFFSFKEQKEALANNTNYQKLLIYTALLRVLFNNGKLSTGATLPTFNQFKDLNNATGKHYQLKTLKEFMVLMNHLKVTQLVGKTRTTLVSYEQAQEILENYLVVDTE